MTQLQMIQRHFDKGLSITGYQAQALYRIASLPRRINDIEELGVKINRERKADATGRAYVQYSK